LQTSGRQVIALTVISTIINVGHNLSTLAMSRR